MFQILVGEFLSTAPLPRSSNETKYLSFPTIDSYCLLTPELNAVGDRLRSCAKFLNAKLCAPKLNASDLVLG